MIPLILPTTSPLSRQFKLYNSNGPKSITIKYKKHYKEQKLT